MRGRCGGGDHDRMSDERRPSREPHEPGAEPESESARGPVPDSGRGAEEPGPAAGPGPGREGGPGADSGARHGGWGARKPAPGSAAAPRERVTRSRRPKVVGGVCTGLGRYFDLDPVIIRVPLVVLAVVGGLGLVFYGLAWLLLPAEGEQENEARRLLSGRVEANALVAVLLALAGCGLFLASYGSHTMPFSLLLAGAVAGAAHWSRHRRRAEAAEAGGASVDAATAHAVADAPPEAHAPPAPDAPSWWRTPLTKDGGHEPPESGRFAEGSGTGTGAGTGVGNGTDAGTATGAGAGTGYLWGPADGAPHSTGGERPPRRRGGGRLGGPLTALAVLAFLAGLFGAGQTQGHWGAGLRAGFACALAVYGAGLVVAAFVGRIGFGTYAMSAVTAALLAFALVLPADLAPHHADWSPNSAAALRPDYHLDTGSGALDLRRLHLTDGRTVRTRARVEVGRLNVVVPRDARVRIDARVGSGQIRTPTQNSGSGGGFRSTDGVRRHAHLVALPPGGAKPKGTVVLSLDVRLGQVEIDRAPPTGPVDRDGGAKSASADGSPGGSSEAAGVAAAAEVR